MGRPSDIIVVGAGIVGCAVAYELARRGASVEIVDERPVGMGATQASAGVLAPYIEAREGSPLLDLTVRSLDLFDDFVARVAGGQRRRRCRIAAPARSTSRPTTPSCDALRTTADVLARRGVPALLLDAQAVRAEEPQLGDGAIGGLLIDDARLRRRRRADARAGRRGAASRRAAHRAEPRAAHLVAATAT